MYPKFSNVHEQFSMSDGSSFGGINRNLKSEERCSWVRVTPISDGFIGPNTVIEFSWNQLLLPENCIFRWTLFINAPVWANIFKSLLFETERKNIFYTYFWLPIPIFLLQLISCLFFKVNGYQYIHIICHVSKKVTLFSYRPATSSHGCNVLPCAKRGICLPGFVQIFAEYLFQSCPCASSGLSHTWWHTCIHAHHTSPAKKVMN